MAGEQRIDVHQHALPPTYLRWLHAHGIKEAGGRELPEWTAEEAIRLMDSHHIARAVLSISVPGVHLGNDGEAGIVARHVNESLSALAQDRPDRFGFFASLPLPDVAGAVTEAVHALDKLAADGVTLLANAHGRYVGDPEFDPLLAELNERGAVVFVHPATLPGPEVPGLPPFAADFLLDTTRAAANLVRHDAVRRFPAIRFILAHGGGFLPYASHRIAAALTLSTGRMPFDLLDDLRSFYFDTALSASPTALPSLLAFAKPGHVLYGTDWPFASELAVDYFTDQLDAYEGVDDALRENINHGAAQALFPSRPGSPSQPRLQP